MICNSCGLDNYDWVRSCWRCRASLGADKSVTPPPQTGSRAIFFQIPIVDKLSVQRYSRLDGARVLRWALVGAAAVAAITILYWVVVHFSVGVSIAKIRPGVVLFSGAAFFGILFLRRGAKEGPKTKDPLFERVTVLLKDKKFAEVERLFAELQHQSDKRSAQLYSRLDAESKRSLWLNINPRIIGRIMNSRRDIIREDHIARLRDYRLGLAAFNPRDRDKASALIMEFKENLTRQKELLATAALSDDVEMTDAEHAAYQAKRGELVTAVAGALTFWGRPFSLIQGDASGIEKELARAGESLLAFERPEALLWDEANHRLFAEKFAAIAVKYEMREIKNFYLTASVKVLTGKETDKLKQLDEAYRSAGSLAARRHVSDLSSSASSTPGDGLDLESFTEYKDLLDALSGDDAQKCQTKGLILSAELAIKPFCRALARRNLTRQKYLFMDFSRLYADFTVASVATEAENIIREASAVQHMDGTGDITLVLDLEAFQSESADDLVRILSFWKNEPVDKRPNLLLLSTAETWQTNLRGLQGVKTACGPVACATNAGTVRVLPPSTEAKSQEEDLTSVMPVSNGLTPASAALLKHAAAEIAGQTGIQIDEDLFPLLWDKIHNKVPFDPVMAAVRLLDSAAAASKTKALTREDIQKAIEALPSLENQPLERRIWARLGDMPAQVQAMVMKKLENLDRFKAGNSQEEYDRLARYLEEVISIPWNEKAPPLREVFKELFTGDEGDIKKKLMEHAKTILTGALYGLDNIIEKDLLTIIVTQIQQELGGASDRPGTAMVFDGPPGVGKTALAIAMAKAMGRPYVIIGLGGVDDRADLAGISSGYVGAKIGRIIEAYRAAGCRDPVIIFDEIDKTSSRGRGDPMDIISFVTDPVNNGEFRDDYLALPFDASETIFIGTSNELPVNYGHLFGEGGRFKVIRLGGYSVEDQIEIGLHFTLKRLLVELGITDEFIWNNTRGLVREMVLNFINDLGARHLETRFEELLLGALRKNMETEGRPTRLAPGGLEEFLGTPPLHIKILPGNKVGEAVYCTSLGTAGIVQAAFENNAPGHPFSLVINGQWGKAMTKSAEVAFHLAQSRLIRWKELFVQGRGEADVPDVVGKKVTLHTPYTTAEDDATKGLAFLAVIVSALFNAPLRRDTVLIGEVDAQAGISALVTPQVLESRLNGARRQEVSRVMLPSKNRGALEELMRNKSHLRGAILDMDRVELRLPFDAGNKRWSDFLNAVQKGVSKKLIKGLAIIPDETYNGLVLRGTAERLIGLWEKSQTAAPPLSLSYALVNNTFDAMRGIVEIPGVSRKVEAVETGAGADEQSRAEEERVDSEMSAPSQPDEQSQSAEEKMKPPEWFRRTVKRNNGESVDLRALAFGLTGDEQLKGIVDLMSDALDMHKAGRTEKERELLDAIVFLAEILSANAPLSIGAVFAQILRQGNTELRDYFARALPPQTTGWLFRCFRQYVYNDQVKRYLAQINFFIILRNWCAVQDAASLDKKSPEQLNASRELLLPALGALIKAIDHEKNTPRKVRDLQIPSKETMDRLKDLEGALSAASNTGDKTARQKLIAALKSLSADIAPLSDFMSQLDGIAHGFIAPETDEDQEYIMSFKYFNAANKSRKPFVRLNADAEASATLGPMIDVYTGNAVLDDMISSKKSTGHVTQELMSEAVFTDRDDGLLSAFGPALDAAVKASRRRVSPAVTLLCRSQKIKERVPGLLAECFKREGDPRRVVSIRYNSLPKNVSLAIPCLEHIFDKARRAGNVVLVVDLDELDERMKVDRYNNHKMLALGRLMNAWKNDESSTRPALVFLGRNETHLDFADKLPVYFNGAAVHEVVIKNEEELLGAEAPSSEQGTRDKIRQLPGDIRRTAERLHAFILSGSGAGSQEKSKDEMRLDFILKMRHSEPPPNILAPLQPFDPAVMERDGWLRSFYKRCREKLEHSKRLLRKTVYGMEETVKRQLYNRQALMFQRTMKNATLSGKPTLLAGPPGVGKSLIGRAFGGALGLKSDVVALGGIRDPSEIDGQFTSYVGALPGFVVRVIEKNGTRYFVLVLDEIDKMAKSPQGDPYAAIKPLLDPEERKRFFDKYLGVPVDASGIIVVATCNDKSKIPEYILSRFEVVDVPPYSLNDKEMIGMDYLMPLIRRELHINWCGVRAGDVSMDDLLTEWERRAGAALTVGELLANTEPQKNPARLLLKALLDAGQYPPETRQMTMHNFFVRLRSGKDLDKSLLNALNAVISGEAGMLKELAKTPGLPRDFDGRDLIKTGLDPDETPRVEEARRNAMRALLELFFPAGICRKHRDEITAQEEGRIVRNMAELYTHEAGVRNLKAELRRLYQSALCQNYKENGAVVVITPEKERLQELLGLPLLDKDQRRERGQVGVAIGLYATESGMGGILFVKADILDRKSGHPLDCTLHGQMAEDALGSAQNALMYVKEQINSGRWDLDPKNFEGHLLFATLASTEIPLGGPSAGVALAVSFLSSVTGFCVRPDVGMTGQIDTKGNVLPIGGLDQKIQAAREGRLTTVLLPADNRGDLLKYLKDNPRMRDVMEEKKGGRWTKTITLHQVLGPDAENEGEEAKKWKALCDTFKKAAVRCGLTWPERPAESDNMQKAEGRHQTEEINISGDSKKMDDFLALPEIQAYIDPDGVMTYVLISTADEAVEKAFDFSSDPASAAVSQPGAAGPTVWDHLQGQAPQYSFNFKSFKRGEEDRIIFVSKPCGLAGLRDTLNREAVWELAIRHLDAGDIKSFIDAHVDPSNPAIKEHYKNLEALCNNNHSLSIEERIKELTALLGKFIENSPVPEDSPVYPFIFENSTQDTAAISEPGGIVGLLKTLSTSVNIEMLNHNIRAGHVYLYVMNHLTPICPRETLTGLRTALEKIEAEPGMDPERRVKSFCGTLSNWLQSTPLQLAAPPSN